MIKKIAIGLCLLLSLSAQAAPQDLGTLFTQTFYSNYVPRRCYDNITRLLNLAEKSGIDTSNANILYITNRGYSSLGLVNAELARGKIKPSETNWQFHAILEMNGLIYDYDFMNSPLVLSIPQYFEKMFFNERPKGTSGSFYVGREQKMKDYEVRILPQDQIMTLAEYLSLSN